MKSQSQGLDSAGNLGFVMQFVGSGVFWGLDLAGCIRAGSGVIPTMPHPMETGISALCHPP